jgi:RND family efflux transporter MFP subunit
MKKIIVIVVVAILLIAGAVAVVEKRKESIANTPTVAPYPLPVEMAEAREESLFIYSHYLGTVIPFHCAEISPRITGNVLLVNVREGDKVEQGQLLATIDDRALREREHAQALEIAGTEAQLAGAKSVYETQLAIHERDEMLQKEGAISLETLQRSKAQKDSSYAQVKSLDQKIKALTNIHQAAALETSYAGLYSPVNGVVSRRLQEPGDLAIPGKPILKVECTSYFKVVVQIPQIEMPLMKKGTKVILSGGQNKFEAVITRVYPAVTANTLGTVEVDIPPKALNIPSGGTVAVDFITGKTEKGVVVPLNALLENQSGSFVFKAEANTAGSGSAVAKVRGLPVRVLGKSAEDVCVRGEIKKGDKVIIGDEGKLLRLTEGMIVIPSGSSGRGQ